MRPAQYFDRRTGRELSATEALHNGVLRDGVSLRVHMSARDSARFRDGRQLWDSGQLCVSDSDLTGSSGNRPGWRCADSPINQRAIADAYRDYEQRLNNSWKSKAQRDADTVCPDCNGDGDIDGEDCERCEGTGELPDDDDNGNGNNKVRPVTADHRMVDASELQSQREQILTPVYDSYARELESAWRKR
jgi:hypothetical protein